METHYFLSYQMNVRRPEFLIFLWRIGVTQGRYIVAEGVEPYIYYVFVVKRRLDSPVEACAGYAQIVETGVDEVAYHFIRSRLRKKKLPVRQKVSQPVLVFGKLEEIGLLLCFFYRPSAIGAAAVRKLGLCPERLAGSAVPAFIMSFVYVPLVVHLLRYCLNPFFMVIVGRSDELIV